MNIDIIDYLGKHGDGVIVSIGIKLEDDYYHGNFYYEKELIALTVEERLEEKIGSSIEDWDKYTEIVYIILNKLVPYEEIINIVSELDTEKYGLYLDKK
jgi:hypothetical protein